MSDLSGVSPPTPPTREEQIREHAEAIPPLVSALRCDCGDNWCTDCDAREHLETILALLGRPETGNNT